MAKIRTLDPEWVERLGHARISLSARFLYLAAVAHADDEGLLLWSAPVAQETLLADADHSLDEVQGWMTELEAGGLVVAYQGEQSKRLCGWIVDFHTHQRIKRKAKPTLPAPPLDNPTVKAAYHRRDRYTCHVCGRSCLPSDTQQAEAETMALTRLTPPTKGTNYPSNIATRHLACNTGGEAHKSATEAPSASAAKATKGPETLTATYTPAPLRETRAATLPHHGGSTLPEHSRSSAGGTVFVPLTCTNTESAGNSRNTTGVLREHSLTEGEVEGEVEGNNPWSAARSTACGGGTEVSTKPAPARTPVAIACGSSASGAREEGPRRAHSNDTPVLVAVGSVLPTADDHNGTSRTHPQAPNRSDATSHLSVAPATIETDAALDANERNAPVSDAGTEPQDSLFDVPEAMVKPTTTPKKRKQPESWTADRKETAHAILRPWWSVYGEGQPQQYGVVFGVVVSCLSNKMTPEEIKEALGVLGQQRKPISGGTIAFALSKTRKQVAEEQTFKQAASSYDVDKYTQREM